MHRLQSVLFDKSRWKLDDAISWCMEHKGIIVYKIHETSKYYRIRQYDPELLESVGFTKPKTINIGNGIKFIYYYDV